MPRTKILHVIPTLDQSGAEKQLSLLAEHLPKDRFEIVVCALTRGGFYQRVLEDAGVAVTVIGKRLKCDPIAFWQLFKFVRECRPDIVHTWLFAGNSYGRLAARLAGVRRIIASERCVDSWKRQYQFAIDRWLQRWTERVVVNSAAVASFYGKAGIPPGKLQVIFNAISTPVANGLPGRTEKLAELGIDSQGPTLGFIGRLWPQKRVHDLIWAADVLRISGWHLNLIIAGDGPRRAALKRFARDLEIDSLVHFLGHRNDSQELLAAMDIVVLPSKFEGLSNVVLEAMRAGKPVVATRIAGMDEVVEDGVTGLLVEPQQPMALATAISKLLRDPRFRDRIAEAGRRRVTEQFTVERMVAAYEQLYAPSAQSTSHGNRRL